MTAYRDRHLAGEYGAKKPKAPATTTKKTAKKTSAKK